MPSHLRKFSPRITRQLSRVADRYVAAECVVNVKAADVSAGTLAHLGVALTADGVQHPSEVMPGAIRGKFSDRNINGWVEVGEDLPKETYTVTIEAPNEHSGTHAVDQTRERYPRFHHGPNFSTIRIDCADGSVGRDSYAFKFEISDVLDREASDFEAQLLRCVNVLQENVGASGVAQAGASFADYSAALRVIWELLPPGSKEDAVRRIFGDRQPSAEERQKVEERYDFLVALTPQHMIYGRSGLQRYFGAQLERDLFVFDNIEVGSAVYVVVEDWEKFSQRSRTELMSGRLGKNFERVIHSGEWKARVLEIIKKHGAASR